MAHRPPHRNLPVSLLTTAGWMRASLQLLPGQSLIDHVQRAEVGGRFLSVVDAEMPRTGDRSPTLSVQRSAVTLIVPDAVEDVEHGATGTGKVHTARFLLEHGYVVGGLRLIGDTRMAGFLAQHDGFFVVHGARLHRNIGSDPVHLPVVLINAARLIGVVETN